MQNYIYTVGILRASDGSIKYYTNNQDDIAAIKEYYCKEKKWWDSGYQEHAIKGFNERELADMILLGVEHYNENCSIETPQYDVFSRNCATWVNCLLKFVGIGDSKREELGEFFGIDWGEESDDLYYYFFKWLP